MLKIKQQGSTCGIVALTYGLSPYVDKDVNELYEELFDLSVDSDISYLGMITDIRTLKEVSSKLGIKSNIVQFDSEVEMNFKISKSLYEKKRIILACSHKGKRIGVIQSDAVQRTHWITICGESDKEYSLLNGWVNTEVNSIDKNDLYNSNSMMVGFYDFAKYHRTLVSFSIMQDTNNKYIKSKISSLKDRSNKEKVMVNMKGLYLEI